MAKLNPKGKHAAVVLALLANAQKPLTTAELRKLVGGFPDCTLWRLTGKSYLSGWKNTPLIQRVSRGKYEVTNLGVAALKEAGLI
jgi:hypothetical protein